MKIGACSRTQPKSSPLTLMNKRNDPHYPMPPGQGDGAAWLCRGRGDVVEGTLLFVRGRRGPAGRFWQEWTDIRVVPEHTAWALSTSVRTPWGDRCGAPTGAVGLTLPPHIRTRSSGDVGPGGRA